MSIYLSMVCPLIQLGQKNSQYGGNELPYRKYINIRAVLNDQKNKKQGRAESHDPVFCFRGEVKAGENDVAAVQGRNGKKIKNKKPQVYRRHTEDYIKKSNKTVGD